MNSFRLVLCLAGLAMFLLVKGLDEPNPESPEQRAHSQALSLQSSAPLNTSWSADPDVSMTTTPRVLLSPEEIDRLEMDGKIVIVARGQKGLLYRVTKPGGEVLIEGATSAELKVLDPELYSKVLALVPLRGNLMGVDRGR